ncbi:MAG: NAD-dependent protein deacetylase [Gammaproteobacteria bacterium]|nr:NAD-dependent protein deacetylase [Gammaproteobacteria bacterium]
MNFFKMSDELFQFLKPHRRLAVLSGAGCSTDSGIPDYRDRDGNWKHAQPVQYGDFRRDAGTRRRYWARSFAGWHRVSGATPNAAHLALAKMETAGRISCLITQNVDNLHRAAGSRNVIDLHGLLRKVRCLDCGDVSSRDRLQERLAALNPDWNFPASQFAPDGDAQLEAAASDKFVPADCTECGGILKPDVVFFGESVPVERVQQAQQTVSESDAMLVIGSSLMVWSGYRFARLAAESGKPLVIINRGKTRADNIASFKMDGGCTEILAQILPALLDDST